MFLSTFAPSLNVSGTITEMTPPPAPAAFIAAASSVLGEKVLELGSSSIVLKEVFETVVADSSLRLTQQFAQIVSAVPREGTVVRANLPSSFAMLTGRTETSTFPSLRRRQPGVELVAVGGPGVPGLGERRLATLQHRRQLVGSTAGESVKRDRRRRHSTDSPSTGAAVAVLLCRRRSPPRAAPARSVGSDT